MSTSRTFTKGLAIASNYEIPDVSSSVKTVYSFSAPTLFDTFKFGYLKLLENAGYAVFNLHGISLSLQVPTDTDLTITMHQEDNDSLISNTSFTLLAGQNKGSKNFQATPLAGLDHTKSFYALVTQSSPPVELAQGAVITYILSDV